MIDKIVKGELDVEEVSRSIYVSFHLCGGGLGRPVLHIISVFIAVAHM